MSWKFTASSESLVKPGMMTTIGVSSEAELCGALVIPTPSTAAIHFLSTSQFAQHICQFTRIIIKLLTANKPRDLSTILSSRLTMRGYNPVQTYSTPICSAVELSVIYIPPHTTTTLYLYDQPNNLYWSKTGTRATFAILPNIWTYGDQYT